MNKTKHTELNRRRRVVVTAAAFAWVVAGTAVPIEPENAAAAQPEAGQAVVAHRAYLSSSKVGTAGALVETGFAEDQRPLGMLHRIDARTREAVPEDAVPAAGASSGQQAAELQRQLDLLNAKPVGDGLVLPPGNVLFPSGTPDFKAGATSNLNRLIKFLDKYPQRAVAIRGYTDSVGGEEYNQGLSERRANSVKAYLVARGIDSARLWASGMGQSAPVAGGRQQSRRVDMIISNPPVALAQRGRTTRMLVLLVLIESISGSSGRPLL